MRGGRPFRLRLPVQLRLPSNEGRSSPKARHPDQDGGRSPCFDLVCRLSTGLGGALAAVGGRWRGEAADSSGGGLRLALAGGAADSSGGQPPQVPLAAGGGGCKEAADSSGGQRPQVALAAGSGQRVDKKLETATVTATACRVGGAAAGSGVVKRLRTATVTATASPVGGRRRAARS